MPMKILVTGASGLLGRHISREVINRDWTCVGLAYSRVSPVLIKCDITNDEEVTALVQLEMPNVIIHAAAERFPDKVENDYNRCINLNVHSSRKLAFLAKSIDCKFIYISTDYVFDGTKPPYADDSEPNPLNKYGQTKLDGEKEVVLVNSDAIILRIPILYGFVEYLNESAVTCLFNLLRSSDVCTVSNYEKRYPSHARDIANILCDMIDLIIKGKSSVCGIYQWSGNEQLTKYEMVKVMSKVLSLRSDHISPDNNPSGGASRPFDSRMKNNRLLSLGINHHTMFSKGILDVLLKWV